MSSPASYLGGGNRRIGTSRRFTRRRRLQVETLEGRSLLALMPYGAMPDDTGEFMLGDVRVNVVLMESDASLSPHNVDSENWTAGAIAEVKGKIESGVNWWKETLAQQFPTAAGLLNFTFDYTYADSPVKTGYEPIANKSNAFESWINDFFSVSGNQQSGSFSSNIRAFNNTQRVQHEAQWSYTIFVVNDANDVDDRFASGGDFRQAFAYAGGQFMVVPASRPASTFAHETGHMFWALDEYALQTPGNYLNRRGYYSTPNDNSADNPDPDYSAQPSIMSNNASLATAFGEHTSSDSSLATIGWKDTDEDGILDVLDVPFSLEGTGRYDETLGTYMFEGHSSVRTLPNRNMSGLGNDITINVVRQAQYSLDGGTWQTAGAYNAYAVDLDLAIPVSPGVQQIRIRTIDTVTGVMSPEYVSDLRQPGIVGSSGVQGYAFSDSNFSGTWDPGEEPISDLPVQIVDQDGNPVVMRRYIDGDDYPAGTVLAQVHPEARMSAIAGMYRSDVKNSQVVDVEGSALYAGRVFGVNSASEAKVVDTWSMASRRLRVDFSTPVSTVSLRAYGSDGMAIGRLEAYGVGGVLLGRYTTKVLDSSDTELMTINTSGSIAFILAGGHQSTGVVLDSLEWGAYSTTTTNSDGSYRIPNLPAGNYHVKVNVPNFQIATTTVGGLASATISGAASTILFGIGQLPNPWHNSVRNYDVDDSGSIDVADVLWVLYYYNQNTNGTPLSGEGPGRPIYADIDNDGLLTPQDILYAVHGLNQTFAAPSSPGGESSGTTTNSYNGGSVGGAGAGEAGADGEAFYFDRIESDFVEDKHHHDDDDDDHDHESHIAESTTSASYAGSSVKKTAEAASTSGVDPAAALYYLAAADDDEMTSSAGTPPTADEEIAATTSGKPDPTDDALLALLDETLV